MDELADLIVSDLDHADARYPDYSIRDGVVLALHWLAEHGYYLTQTPPVEDRDFPESAAPKTEWCPECGRNSRGGRIIHQPRCTIGRLPAPPVEGGDRSGPTPVDLLMSSGAGPHIERPGEVEDVFDPSPPVEGGDDRS